VSQVGRHRSVNFVSPELQRAEMDAWAHFRGVEILRFHTDLDVSGAKLTRPALEQALLRAEAGASDGILVARLDRFARNLTGALETIRRLEKAGATFVSVAEGLDPTTPAGKMLVRVMLLTAEFELDGIRESWDQSRRQAVARGIHLSSVPPTGYRRGRGGRLVLNEASAPHLAELFRMRAEYRSWHEMHAHVAETGLENPFGTAKWTTASLLEVMANRVYLGEARCGPHRNRDAHEPLIGRGTWELAQLTRTLTATRSARPALLSGLLRCAGCVHVMASAGEMDSRPGTARKYRCTDRVSGGCPLCCVVGGREIEDYVVSQVFRMYGQSRIRRAASESSLRRAEGTLASREADLDELEAGSIEPGGGPGEEIGAARAAIGTARERLISLTRSRLMPSPALLRDRWPRMSVGERRRHLALLIDAVIVREDRGLGVEDRVLITPFGEGPRALPVRGRSIRLAPISWGTRRIPVAASAMSRSASPPEASADPTAGTGLSGLPRAA
jgi:DNA invertase Pin-like site-specific DNA recombinase